VIAWTVVMMKTLFQHSADCASSFVSDLLYIQCCPSAVDIRVLFYLFEQHLKIASIYVLFVPIDSCRSSVFLCAITDSPLCPFVCFFILLFCTKVLLLIFHIYCISVVFQVAIQKLKDQDIYRAIILPVVLYGCETWLLTLREERSLRVFENRVLRVFGPKRDEVTG
jgi:hypothetical protein